MSKQLCQTKDTQFPCHQDEFAVPTFESLGIQTAKFSPTTPSIYFCGNSLGLMPKDVKPAVIRELDAWSARGVESHFNHPDEPVAAPWVDVDLPLLPLLAPVVGALESEVAAMGTLTSNLNALLVSFYKPKGHKTKILFEKQAFPSDYYAFVNLVKLFGYDESHLIQIEVPQNHTYLKTSLILEAIDAHKHELALVCFPGIQYYTGQLFDIETITRYAKQRDIVVGWDLAHAVGNVPLKLHDWEVDFAAWCSYKYLNSGPGAIAGIFVHEKYTKDNSPDNFAPRLAGWWGNNGQERFKMLESFDPIKSALSYRQSNPSVIDVVSLHTSLKLLHAKGGVDTLRVKSVEMTNYLLEQLQQSEFYIDQDDHKPNYGFQVLTPLNEHERGCQLSLLFKPDGLMDKVFGYLHEHAIIVDERRPSVIRLAPVPLYNTFEQVYYVVKRLNEGLDKFKP
ncbi:Kynureninase (L-kynurenine hydrolase) [Yamadazyma tenuis]|uniref:Kynureninase n=1 Tax=Candida tenuis (strain ATCC 10573 / BCRC 21748 / CBS 615 / JCM 9827 / NBRC 10315 / NRRL Y-1498 / VKM Y-70) TaxID=590646 RepID=G3B383_CANTC|nr:kynureninase [Yamadazyma tenuis ATCC 10573]EGV64104.1 kynureninase [Yamadazyma tenuis ATCC 10573]WEJ96260.1 Kynureninase (L-kynurenine hydrolase) [Yamadazyma tenuis]